MKILIGYITTFAYVFFLIFFLGEFVKKKTNLETSRKIIHTMLFMVWIVIDYFFKNTIHQIVVPAAFWILNSLSYRFKIYKSVERDNDNHHGTIYFAIAITVIMAIAYFHKEMYLASGAASFCLTVGDGFAALIGFNFKSSKIRATKTWYGFIACFIATLIALFCFKMIWWRELGVAEVLLLSTITAITELTSGGLDNFTISFSVFGLSWLLCDVLVQPAGSIALSWACIIFLIVFISRAIEYRGALLSMLIVFAFRYYAGRSGLFFLLGTYFVIFSIGLLRKSRLSNTRIKHDHERNWIQIAINGGIGTIAIILYGKTLELWLLATGITVIGGCFIDSISSDAGGLSTKEPYDFLRRKRIPCGLSGGVSALGTGTAAVFALMIGVYSCFALHFPFNTSALICVLAFLQTIIDTLLGSLLQVKYQCVSCNTITENKTHCNIATRYVSGIKWIDNNVVNLMSSLFIAAISVVVFGILK